MFFQFMYVWGGASQQLTRIIYKSYVYFNITKVL